MCLPEFCAPVPAHEDFQVAGTVVKNPPASAGDIRDVSLTPELVRSPGEGNGNPFQYSCLENSMDRAAWWATVYGVIKELDPTDQLSTR